MNARSWSLEELEDRSGDDTELASDSGHRNGRPVNPDAEDGATGEPDPGPELEERIRTLEEEAEEEYRRGYEDGLEEGRREAREELEEEVASAVDALREAAGEMEIELPRWEDAVEDNLCALAVAVARRLVGEKVEGDREVLRRTVREALDRFPPDEPVTLRMHPDDLSLIRDASGDPELQLGSGRDVEWRSDEELNRGGCLAEGPEHVVDGRTDRALLRLYKELSRG